MEDTQDDDVYMFAAQTIMGHNQAILAAEEDEIEKCNNQHDEQHRAGTIWYSKRAIYYHAEALHCIKRDHLGEPNNPLMPVFNSRQFDLMFRISRTRFQCLMEDIAATGNTFYLNQVDAKKKNFEAKLLLQLKTLDYGVAAHAFCDYFQMSPGFARSCCREFDKAVMDVYQKEYLRLPTPADLKAITKLHKTVHKVDGMFGSLDCSHTTWKNCPKAWQGSFRGKEKKSTIVLEAICDYHLWFWHCSYGYAGTLNDKTILNLSPFLESFVNGKFSKLETEAGVVPFNVQDEEFKKLFVLVDGIYPRYSRFVRGIKEPISEEEKSYTAWQKGARKDIERAFGVFEGKFQWISRLIHLHNLKDIAKRVGTCLVLHNMCVPDRIMEGDPRATYNPAASVQDELVLVEAPEDLREVQGFNDGASSID